MPSWYLKAGLQGAMSRLPDPQAANRLFQKHVTKGLQLSPAYFESKVDVARRHLDNWSALDAPHGGRKSLELGTGWMPIVPIAMSLIGEAEATTIDVQRLMRPDDIRQSLEMFQQDIATHPARYAAGAQEQVAAALALAPDIDAMLAAVGVSSSIGDARALDADDDTFDLVTSNNTFEHIPLDDLRAMLEEFRRVVRPNGGMSHLIDLQDHYAGFDGSITVYNFLGYTERQWAKFNNELHYQNRLRWPQYTALLVDTGWTVDNVELTSDLDGLARVKVDPSFSQFSDEELAVHTAWVSSQVSARAGLMADARAT